MPAKRKQQGHGVRLDPSDAVESISAPVERQGLDGSGCIVASVHTEENSVALFQAELTKRQKVDVKRKPYF